MPSNDHETAPALASLSDASDGSLLRHLQAGNQEAASEVYLRFAHRLRALVKSQCSSELAKRVETEDIVQSVFRRFFRRATEGGYQVPPGDELWGIFLVIALNKIRTEENFHRAGKRDMRLMANSEQSELLLKQFADNTQQAALYLQLTVKEAVEKLPALQQQLVELRMQGYSVNEIADQTKRSRRTIERNLQSAREKLQTLLEEDSSLP
jgi:RNA polymerase sigma-70 factor (ECF subfamily)